MKKIIALLFILILISCNNDDDSNTPFEPLDLNFTTIGQGQMTGNEGILQSNLVIDNENDWNNLLNQMNSSFAVTDLYFNSTQIDFETEMAIAIFLEVKQNGCIVEITSVIENQSNINVFYDEIQQITAIINQPFHIIKISKINKPIVVEWN